jgi:thiamine biosynthesis lipoprotein
MSSRTPATAATATRSSRSARRSPTRRSAGQPARRRRAAGTTSGSTAPPGLAFDGGGLVKGLAADILAVELRGHESFAVDAAGDLRLGGRLEREVRVASPFDGTTIHTYRVADAGVATSGIGRRAWRDAEGRPAHHLLDPSTGRPAYTGVVQATALAPTACQAEVRAKAAVLSGPVQAPQWLPDGGVLVFDDAGHSVVPARERAAA